MKIIIKKEYDGQFYVGSCENVPGCYVQARTEDELRKRIQRALLIIKKSCQLKSQPFPTGSDRPILNLKIRFKDLSTDQLVKILESHQYHLEYMDEQSVLLVNTEFPFNRIHLPRSTSLSPLLVEKIFGKENTIWVGSRKNLKLSRSVS